MEISDITLEMELNGVGEDDIAEILTTCNKSGYHAATLDEELQKRGYEALFSIDYDAYDDWGDNEYTSVEKIRHRDEYR